MPSRDTLNETGAVFRIKEGGFEQGGREAVIINRAFSIIYGPNLSG